MATTLTVGARVRIGLDEIGGGVEHVLAVVEHEQQAPPRQRLGDAVGHRPAGCGVIPSTVGHRIGHGRRVADRRQLDEPHSVRELGDQLGGDLHGQAGLADAAHPDQRDQPVTSHQLGQLLHLDLTTDEARDCAGRFPGTPSIVRKRRKLDRQTVGADLEQPLDARQVPQAVLAQVPQIDPGHEPRGRAATSTWPPWPAAMIRAVRFSAGPK